MDDVKKAVKKDVAAKDLKMVRYSGGLYLVRFTDSGKLLEEMAGTGDWQEGKRFSSHASEEEVQDWVKSLNLN